MATALHEPRQTAALATIIEVANRLSISRSSVYGLMDGGQLSFVKLGRARRIPWQAVERLIEANTVRGTS